MPTPTVYATISVQAKEVPITVLARLEWCKPSSLTNRKYCRVSITYENIKTKIAVATTGVLNKAFTEH